MWIESQYSNGGVPDSKIFQQRMARILILSMIISFVIKEANFEIGMCPATSPTFKNH